jgi:hypothetical protein
MALYFFKFFYFLVPMVGWGWAFFYYEVFRWVTNFSTSWCLWLVGDGPCSTMKFSGKLQIFLLLGTYGWLEMGVLLLWSFQVSYTFFHLLVPMVGWGWALFYYEVFRWVANFSTCWYLWLDGDGYSSTMKFSGQLQIFLLVGAYVVFFSFLTFQENTIIYVHFQ